jgi:hypothetical protein
MNNFDSFEHHPFITEVGAALAAKTNNPDPAMFRIMSAWHLTKSVSNMHGMVKSAVGSPMPINMYAICLAPSGAGKGHAMSTLEQGIFGRYYTALTEKVEEAEHDAINKMSAKFVSEKGLDEGLARAKAEKEVHELGPYVETFDSGTSPAIKQLRAKIQQIGFGALNLQIDEIGSNLTGSEEGLTTFLELYDLGQIKQKITKVTKESTRTLDKRSCTPANLLMFGTPSKLFDGGNTEKLFIDLVTAGYARRSFFSWQASRKGVRSISQDEAFQKAVALLTALDASPWIEKCREILQSERGKVYVLTDKADKQLFAYRVYCEQRSEEYPEHQEDVRAEMMHRHIKTMKIAAAFAALERLPVVLMRHINHAIALTEESGTAFQTMLTRDKAYVRLAKYITSNKNRVTQADLVSALPFYTGSQSARNDMMLLATSWAYSHDKIIKKEYADNIEFFSGDSLEQTDLEAIPLSYSNHMADNYTNSTPPWEKLPKLLLAQDLHFTNHFLAAGEHGMGHRSEANIVEGCNFIVLDVDGTASLPLVRSVLTDYKYFIYTTKSHKDDDHHYRIVMPISHKVRLNRDSFQNFMRNIYNWLPFEVDVAAKDRCRKWASHPGQLEQNEGILLDATQFIPHTVRQEKLALAAEGLKNLPALERWFALQMSAGNRNNMLARFAFVLVDSGLSLPEIETRVISLNNSQSDKLSMAEVQQTVLRSVAQRIQQRGVI